MNYIRRNSGFHQEVIWESLEHLTLRKPHMNGSVRCHLVIPGVMPTFIRCLNTSTSVAIPGPFGEWKALMWSCWWSLHLYRLPRFSTSDAPQASKGTPFRMPCAGSLTSGLRSWRISTKSWILWWHTYGLYNRVCNYSLYVCSWLLYWGMSLVWWDPRQNFESLDGHNELCKIRIDYFMSKSVNSTKTDQSYFRFGLFLCFVQLLHHAGGKMECNSGAILRNSDTILRNSGAILKRVCFGNWFEHFS